MRLTMTQRKVLHALLEGPLTDMGMSIQGANARTRRSLEGRGLVKYRPYGKPFPTWVITPGGKGLVGA